MRPRHGRPAPTCAHLRLPGSRTDVPPAAEPAWRCPSEQARSALPGHAGGCPAVRARDGKISGRSGVSTVRGASLRPRSRPRRIRFVRDRSAGREHGPRPARRRAGLPPVLARRAPQHAGDRELVARGADRAPGGRDQPDPRRLRRGDAAQPPAARDRRAVRHARGAAPGPHRPRHRPRARHRPATARALRRGADPLGADDFPDQLVELVAYFRGDGPGRGRAGEGARADDLAAGLERLQRAARRDARPAVRVRAPLQRAEHAARARALPGDVPAVGGARRSRTR